MWALAIDFLMDITADVLLKRGYEARRENRPDDAKRAFSGAIELCRASGDRAGLAQAYAGLGQIERDLHNGLSARGHYEESVAILRGLDRPLKLAHTVRHLGDILREQGEHALAEPFYVEALEIYRRDDETAPLDLANTVRGYALLKAATGETREALLLWREARDLYAHCSLPVGVAESERQISLLAAV